MNDATREENEQFANEVLRIARALWPSAKFHGASILDGREVDGLFTTDDCLHFIEATTSRRQDKARGDVEKLKKNIDRQRGKSGTRALRGWFVTRDEPTGDQRRVTAKYRQDINVLSLAQFRSGLIDSHEYLSARDEYAFGSVRDPVTGKHNAKIQYVPLDILQLHDRSIVSPQDLCGLVTSGKTVVLLGDYGAGKSMTLRHVYHTLRKRHMAGREHRFPVYLNLRDHYGQTDSAEVLERHARSIGFYSSAHLVRAWRAGSIHLLVDGFDEVSGIAIQGLWRTLQDSRFRSMEVVRHLLRDTPDGSGILVAGRAHFFDTPAERRKALGLRFGTIELSLNDFTLEQIDTYLSRAGVQAAVPPWLPARPLLLGYLAARGILTEEILGPSGGENLGPAVGWDTLLESVCAREAEIEAGIDGHTVRHILERLATRARGSVGGLGSLGPNAIVDAFCEVCGYDPDERGMVLLQRLPGLGVDREEEQSRTFMDESFADASRAGDVVRFVTDPYNFPDASLSRAEAGVGPLALEVASHRLQQRHVSAGKMNAALRVAEGKGLSHTVADIVRLMFECGFVLEESLQIDSLIIPTLDVDDDANDMSRLCFRGCLFDRVEIAPTVAPRGHPTFRECYVHEMYGRISVSDLPDGMFDDKCEIGVFVEAAETINEVLALELPLGTRVCITVLKKLYEQSGSGRRESALHRGLDSHAQRFVSGVLHVLRSEGLASRDRSRRTTIWRPDRRRRARVGKMIAAPTRSTDPALQRCGSL